MPKAKLRFTERDVSRAIRAATKAGVQVGRVVIDTAGNIFVVAAQPGDAILTPFDQAKSVGPAQLNGC
jgi:hypothetical protein